MVPVAWELGSGFLAFVRLGGEGPGDGPPKLLDAMTGSAAGGFFGLSWDARSLIVMPRCSVKIVRSLLRALAASRSILLCWSSTG